MVDFQDLPFEVIEIIVSYLDNYTLSRLMDYPIIGEHAARSIYSTITIEDSDYPSIATDPFYEEHISTFKSYSDYLSLLNSCPSGSVKYLVLKNPFDALELDRKCPDHLQDLKIKLIFGSTKINKKKAEIFAQQYRRSPFSVDSIVSRCSIQSYELPWFELSKNVTALHAFDDNLKGVCEIFTNLTSLRLDRILTPNDFNFLPQSLIVFHCNLMPKEGHSMEIQFPGRLMKLFMNICVKRGFENSVYSFDITGATFLQNLELFSHFCLPNASIRLPNGIKQIKIEQINLGVTNLASTCPNLISFKSKGRDSPFLAFYEPAWIFPESLQHLNIPSNYLMRNDITSYRVRYSVKFPPGLIELGIYGCQVHISPIVIDFQLNQLSKLRILSICNVPHLDIIGVIPRTITKLVLERVPAFTLNQLSYITNLTELYISEVDGGRSFYITFLET